MIQNEAESVKDLAKPNNDVLERLGWKWKPEPGEWFLNKQGNPRLMIGFNGYHIEDAENLIYYPPEIVPILHWEEIERVLEGVGYIIEIETFSFTNYNPYCKIYKKLNFAEIERIVKQSGKSRQEAVMKAVIKLAEEINVHRSTST